jgi:hypothetical protein
VSWREAAGDGLVLCSATLFPDRGLDVAVEFLPWSMRRRCRTASRQDECMVERALPGEGTSDLQGLLSAFEEIGATPLIAPEIFNRALAG